MIDPKKFPKAARLQQQREERFQAEQERLKAISAQPKRSETTHKKIKADIEAAGKTKPKVKPKQRRPS